MKRLVGFLLLLVTSLAIFSSSTAQIMREEVVTTTEEEIKAQIKEGVMKELQEMREEKLTLEESKRQELEDLESIGGRRELFLTIKRNNGEELRLRLEEQIREGEIERKLIYQNKEGFEENIISKLRIRHSANERLIATLSNGEEREITDPETIKDKLKEKYNSANEEMGLLEEIDRNIPKVLYHIRSDRHGKFLGIFKMNMEIDSYLESETGEELRERKPWWAFLVKEEGLTDEEFEEVKE